MTTSEVFMRALRPMNAGVVLAVAAALFGGIFSLIGLLNFVLSTAVFSMLVFGINAILYWANGIAFLGFWQTVAYGALLHLFQMLFRGLFN